MKSLVCLLMEVRGCRACADWLPFCLPDVIGWNVYRHNSWWVTGQTIGFGTPGFTALSDLLTPCANRYLHHPMILSETGAEGSARPAWLHYIGQECALAKGRDVPPGRCLPLSGHQLSGMG